MSAADDWRAGVERVHAESAGLIEMHVIRHGDAPGLIAAGLCGDRLARRLMIALNHALTDIAKAETTSERRECVKCERPLRSGRYSVCLVGAAGSEVPTQLLALAVCARCGPDLPTIRKAATDGLKFLWPDARPIELTGTQTGHA